MKDIGEKLGCMATMSRLERIKSGKFDLTSSVKLEELENNPEIKDAIHDISSRKDGVINIHIDRSYLELTLFGIRFCNICIG